LHKSQIFSPLFMTVDSTLQTKLLKHYCDCSFSISPPEVIINIPVIVPV
jgi:hypothetical protein